MPFYTMKKANCLNVNKYSDFTGFVILKTPSEFSAGYYDVFVYNHSVFSVIFDLLSILLNL